MTFIQVGGLAGIFADSELGELVSPQAAHLRIHFYNENLKSCTSTRDLFEGDITESIEREH